MAKIILAGIGPGSMEDITPAVQLALKEADAVVGYKYYFQFVQPYLRPNILCVDTGMKKETARSEEAFLLVESEKTVCVIGSGDVGIYGMASLVYEMKRNSEVEVVCLPGISAFQKAASLLGEPVSHDFCVISLSDLMTPWKLIERRIRERLWVILSRLSTILAVMSVIGNWNVYVKYSCRSDVLLKHQWGCTSSRKRGTGGVSYYFERI